MSDGLYNPSEANDFASSNGCPANPELSAFLSGEVSHDREAAVETHLEHCEQCRARFDELSSASSSKFSRFSDLLRDAASGPTDQSPGPALPDIPGYTIERELGRGGMGVVLLAGNHALGRKVALKMLLQGALAGPERIRRFEREARTIAQLNHPNIIHIHEIFEHAGLPCLALEYIRGPSLAREINDTPQPARVSAALVEQVARAVSVAHRAGVLHRDLKPANILLDTSRLSDPQDAVETRLLHHQEWPRIQPKLSDFGLAGTVDDQGLTLTGDMLGTPRYLAPELLTGKPVWSPHADIYAIGAILFELLSGKPPFAADNLTDTLDAIRNQPPPRLPGTPGDLQTIYLTCLAKNPAKRYRDADALADDLQRFGSGRPILAKPPGLLLRCAKFARRRPAFTSLLLAVLALLGLWARFTAQLRIQTKIAHERTRTAEQALDAQTGAREAAEEVLSFMTRDLFEATRFVEDGSDARVIEMLAAAEGKLAGGRFDERPETELAIRETVGRLYRQLGRPNKSLHHLERAVYLLEQLNRNTHLETRIQGKRRAELMTDYAESLHLCERTDEAVVLLEQLLASNELAVEARFDVRLRLARMEIHESPDRDRMVRQLEDLRAGIREQLGSGHRFEARLLGHLALAYRRTKQTDAATRIHREQIAVLTNTKGAEAYETLQAINNLGAHLTQSKQYAEARRIHERLQRTLMRVLGPRHNFTIVQLHNLGTLYLKTQEYQPAEDCLRRSIDGHVDLFGTTHANTLLSFQSLGRVYLESRQFAKGVAFFDRRVAPVIGQHRSTADWAMLLSVYARLRAQTKNPSGAEELLLIIDRMSGDGLAVSNRQRDYIVETRRIVDTSEGDTRL